MLGIIRNQPQGETMPKNILGDMETEERKTEKY